MAAAPTEPKVQAASVTAAVSGAVLYLLQHYVFKGDVPDGVASMVYIAVPGVLAYAAGWLAPHQDRPQPQAALTPLGPPVTSGNVTVTTTPPAPTSPPAGQGGAGSLKPPADLT